MKMPERVKGLIILLPVITFLAGCTGNNRQQIEERIIAKEKAILDEWGKGHTMIFPANCADGITYFDPSLDKRIDGVEEFTAHLKPVENKFTIEKYEMVDPEVQVHGEIAVLTYNLTNYARNPRGEMQKFCWNTTEVYLNTGGDWKIIHSHWSFTKPQMKT